MNSTDSNPPITLFGNWRSSSTQRVICGLELKQIPYSYRPINLDNREQEGEAFRALHPGGQLPVLMIGEAVYSQSLAILESLDDLFPGHPPALLPETATARLRAREIAEFVNSRMQPFQLPLQVRRLLADSFQLEAHPLGAEAACQAFVRAHLAQTLPELDRLVGRSPGPFCVGDQAGLAECLVVPQLQAAVRSGLDLNAFSALSGLFERCQVLPAFRRAHPLALADAPDPTAGASAMSAQPVLAAALAGKEPDALISQYLQEQANAPIPGLEEVRNEALRRFGPLATKVTALDVCWLLRWLATTLAAKQVLEIGVFTGSSSLALLAGMPADGQLIAFDVSADYTDVAQQAWQQQGLAGRVDLRLEDAGTGLRRLAAEAGRAGSLDLAFVDGCNTQYLQNHEDLLPLMRRGGVIVYDNVLWKGRVAAADRSDDQTQQLRDLNSLLRRDPRVSSCVLRLGDGLALAVKR